MPDSCYTIGLLVEGLDLDDDHQLDALFTKIPESVPSRVNGVTTVTATLTADSAMTAALLLARRLEQVSKVSAVAVDQDMVAIPDIAQRVGRTRESVRQLVDGKRGPGNFPAPVGTVGDGIRIWPWAAVAHWFNSALHQDLGDQGILPRDASIVDVALRSGSPTPPTRRLPADSTPLANSLFHASSPSTAQAPQTFVSQTRERLAAAQAGKVLSAIMQSDEPITTSQLQNTLGMPEQLLATAINLLLQRHYLISATRGGIIRLRLDDRRYSALGIKILPGRLFGVVTNLRGALLHSEHRLVSDHSASGVVSAITALVQDLRAVHSSDRARVPLGIGIELV